MIAMHHRSRLVWGVICPLALTLAGRAFGAAPENDALILDESGYCRAYYRFDFDRISAPALKAEGEKLLAGQFEGQGLRRLENDTKRRLENKKIDWSKADWRDCAVCRIFRQGGDYEYQRETYTVPPPPNWGDAGFDDGNWPRFRLPFAVGGGPDTYVAQWRMPSPGLRSAHLRYRFDIADPRKASALTLKLTYVGGVRVLLNGTEIARGGLPQGEITAETPADDYPLDAYMRLFDELGDKEKERAQKSLKARTPPRHWGYVGYLPSTSFEEAQKPSPGLTRACWERISGLRNRALALVKIPGNLLRKGANLLAIEVLAAPLHPIAATPDWQGLGSEHSAVWLHARLVGLELRSAANDIPSALRRPAGAQVWTEDMHYRVHSPDYLEPGAVSRPIRLAGAKNGTYAAQIVVGTDKELSGVAITPGALKAASGNAAIPASATRVGGMLPTPAAGFPGLGQGRLPTSEAFSIYCAPIAQAAMRYAPLTPQQIQFFDQVEPLGTPLRSG